MLSCVVNTTSRSAVTWKQTRLDGTDMRRTRKCPVSSRKVRVFIGISVNNQNCLCLVDTLMDRLFNLLIGRRAKSQWLRGKHALLSASTDPSHNLSLLTNTQTLSYTVCHWESLAEIGGIARSLWFSVTSPALWMITPQFNNWVCGVILPLHYGCRDWSYFLENGPSCKHLLLHNAGSSGAPPFLREFTISSSWLSSSTIHLSCIRRGTK